MTKNTIDSIFQYDHPFSYEIFVVDNASNDGTVEYIREHFPEIHLIESKENLNSFPSQEQPYEVSAAVVLSCL